MTLEETQARIEKIKKRRRRATAACLAVALSSIGAGVWAASKILPLYGKWEYETRRESHRLVDIDRPAYLSARILYEKEPPSGIILLNQSTGEELRDAIISSDQNKKEISIGCDIGAPGSFEVSLVPADNYELKYQVDLEPSYAYMDGGIWFAKDKNGDLWIKIAADYPRCDSQDGVRVLVQLSGMSYAPMAYDGWIPQPDDDGDDGGGPSPIEINLSELCRRQGHDLSKASSVQASATAGCEPRDGSERVTVNLKDTKPLKEWPGYDPGQKELSFDISDTESYLASLGLGPEDDNTRMEGDDDGEEQQPDDGQ